METISKTKIEEALDFIEGLQDSVKRDICIADTLNGIYGEGHERTIPAETTEDNKRFLGKLIAIKKGIRRGYFVDIKPIWDLFNPMIMYRKARIYELMQQNEYNTTMGVISGDKSKNRKIPIEEAKEIRAKGIKNNKKEIVKINRIYDTLCNMVKNK